MQPQTINLDDDIENFFYAIIMALPGKGVLTGVSFDDLVARFNPPGHIIHNLYAAWEKAQNDFEGNLKKAFAGNPNQAAFLCDKWFGYCLSLTNCFKDPQNDKQRITNNFKKIAAGDAPMTRQMALEEQKKKKAIESRKLGAAKVRDAVINGMITRDGRKAVAHILCHEVFRLDPVIGDAACEMRPPFILDACTVILDLVRPDDLPGLQKLGRSYVRMCDEFEKELVLPFQAEIKSGYFSPPLDVQNPSIFMCDQVFILLDEYFRNEPNIHGEFIDFCNLVIKNMGPENFEYLGLCKAMTTTRLMIYDRLGISLGDFQIENLPPAIRGDFKVRLGTHSTRYIRQITGELSSMCTAPTEISLFPQLNNVISCCNVDLYTESRHVPILPIYEGMRAITTYELVKGRPLVFVFNRMVIKSGDIPATHKGLPLNTVNVPNEIACVSFDPIVIMYVPDQVNGRYLPCDDITSELSTMPCTVYECWSVLNLADVPGDLSDPILAGLYSPDKDQFIAAIKQCDIAHLMQLYAASHPPMGGRATPQSNVNIKHANFALDGGLSCTMELHKRASGGSSRGRIEDLHNAAFAKLDQLKNELEVLEKQSSLEITPIDEQLKQARLGAKGKGPVADEAKKLIPGLENALSELKKKWDKTLATPRKEYQELLEATLLIQEEEIINSGEILPLNFKPQLLCTASGNLADEYLNYRKSSMACNMLFSQPAILSGYPSQVVYHIKLKTPDLSDCVFQYRYSRSIFFRISHILPSTYAVTCARVKLVMVNLADYRIGCLIDMTYPGMSLEDAKSSDKDSYYRDDQ